MKMLYCWRCRVELPMLDEQEYARVATLQQDAMLAIRTAIQDRQPIGKRIDREALFRAMCQAYYDITGFRESNPNAIMHHRLALYGIACTGCGKPLRSPQASYCTACGLAKHAMPRRHVCTVTDQFVLARGTVLMPGVPAQSALAVGQIVELYAPAGTITTTLVKGFEMINEPMTPETMARRRSQPIPILVDALDVPLGTAVWVYDDGPKRTN